EARRVVVACSEIPWFYPALSKRLLSLSHGTACLIEIAKPLQTQGQQSQDRRPLGSRQIRAAQCPFEIGSSLRRFGEIQHEPDTPASPADQCGVTASFSEGEHLFGCLMREPALSLVEQVADHSFECLDHCGRRSIRHRAEFACAAIRGAGFRSVPALGCERRAERKLYLQFIARPL